MRRYCNIFGYVDTASWYGGDAGKRQVSHHAQQWLGDCCPQTVTRQWNIKMFDTHVGSLHQLSVQVHPAVIQHISGYVTSMATMWRHMTMAERS